MDVIKTKVLLTGGRGMVGSNILEHPSSSNWEFIAPTRKELNLKNYNEVFNYLSDAKPEYIIHAAGHVGGISSNISNPVDFLVNNLDIGRNIVIAAHAAGISKLLNLGASCLYPRNASNPLKEEMILTGKLEPTNEPYALAKIVVAKLCEYINKENPKYQYKTMIPCNIFGRFDKFDPANSHLIPAIIDKLHRAKKNNISTIEIWGDGNARREFMYTQDLADAVLYALDHFDTMPSFLNIGVGVDHTINEYYSIVSQVLGFQGNFKHNLAEPTGMKQKLISIDKQNKWGWSPKISLKDGIEKTYNYYLQK